MPVLCFRAVHLISWPSPPTRKPSGKMVAFEVDTELGRARVRVDERFACVETMIASVEVGDELYNWLPQAEPMHANEYPPSVREEISSIFACLDSAARTVVETAKYFLGKLEVLDDVLTSPAFFWGRVEEKLKPFPGLGSASMTLTSDISLTPEVCADLQFSLDEKIKPFAAMRHLYRAFQESVPRFQWIDATIAAELAVKEALIRREPTLEALLLNIPSPPMRKLYGDILEYYFGCRSPVLNELDKGATMRNKLVHRPEKENVSEQAARNYVTTVMQGIHHLYQILYPEWRGAERLNQIQRSHSPAGKS